MLRFNESHFYSSPQFGVYGQEHTLRFAGFQVKEISILLGLPKVKCRKKSVCAWEVFGFPDLVGPDHFLNNVYLHVLQRAHICSEHVEALEKKKKQQLGNCLSNPTNAKMLTYRDSLGSLGKGSSPETELKP